MKIVQFLPGNKAVVSNGGVSIEADISLLENPELGKYAIVHAGYALEIVRDDEAREQLAMFSEMGLPEAPPETPESKGND